MASCELCGRGMKGRGRDVVIEGASMRVCPQCAAKFGGVDSSEGKRPSFGGSQRPHWAGGADPLKPQSSAPPRPKSAPKHKPAPKSHGVRLEELELVEDYAERIREARQKSGISQEELAQRVGERISTLQSIESGRQKPTERTIRGLERELEISLLEAVGAVPIKVSRDRGSEKGDSATLGDRVVVKRKMSQKARRDDTETK